MGEVRGFSPEDEKNKKWEAEIESLKSITDAEGKGIEQGIIETVAAFNLNGLNVTQSCEGHEDRGLHAPWVDVSSPGKPEERWNNEKKIFQEAAEKHQLDFEEIYDSRKRSFHLDDQKYMDAVEEALQQCLASGETQQFKQWIESNQLLRDRVQALLDEFYDDADIEEDSKITIDEVGFSFRVHNGGEDFEKDFTQAGPEEIETVSENLEKYRQEMKRFTDFLRQKI